MPHTRKTDQTVDAFSAPTQLLAEAKLRAATMGMTKSGFFRYCLAKELGYTEAEARDLAQHAAVTNSIAANRALYPAVAGGRQALNSAPADPAGSALKKAVASVERAGVKYGRSRKAASTSGKIS